jgi:hypothetical protein
MYIDTPQHTSLVRRLTSALAPLTLTGELLSAVALNQVPGAVGIPLQTAHAGTLPSGNPMLLLLATGSNGAIAGSFQPNGPWSTQSLAG